MPQEYVESHQNASLKDDFNQKKVVLPEYLTRRCPTGLCEGRLLKTVTPRHAPVGVKQGPNDSEAARGRRGSRSLSDTRWLSALVRVGTTSSPGSAGRGPGLGWRPTSKRTRVLLSDDMPEEFDSKFLYAFLFLSSHRAKRGWFCHGFPPQFRFGLGLILWFTELVLQSSSQE